MVRNKICIRCGNTSDIQKNLKKITTSKIISINNQCDYEKIYCPYYQHSEICHSAYYYSYSTEDCFKDAYNCCYCSHKVGDDDGNFFCDYDYYDKEVKNMYYLRPIVTGNAKEFKVIKLITTYWECPICKTWYRMSCKEK